MPERPILLGDRVRLEPLQASHLDAMCRVGLDEALWQWTPRRLRTRDDMAAYIDQALAAAARDECLPFAIVERESDTVAGCTRLGALDLAHRRGEIGWTWIATAWQRTFVNTEAKLLLLAHAFETLDFNRVEFRTDALNERSRNAILRLGARQEGILRQHMVTESGRIRDTVVFGIIREEWSGVKAGLEAKLKQYAV